jgi:hypothetical protein
MLYLDDYVDVSTLEIGVKVEIFISPLAIWVHPSEMEFI